jgi:1,4-dihydroxy-2-naphthoate octaprenyltransferase
LAVHLGREYSLWAYRVFIVAAYCSIVLLVLNGIVGRLALVSFVTLPAAVGVDRMISSSIDWRELHDKGSRVRIFYLVNGLILIAAVLIG